MCNTHNIKQNMKFRIIFQKHSCSAWWKWTALWRCFSGVCVSVSVCVCVCVCSLLMRSLRDSTVLMKASLSVLQLWGGGSASDSGSSERDSTCMPSWWTSRSRLCVNTSVKGMCNSHRVLESQRRSIMKTIFLIGYSSTLGGTLSSECLAGHSPKYRRE